MKYEQDAYEDLLRRTPKEESFVDTPEGRGTVVGVQLLRQQVKVQMEDAPDTVHSFHIEEIAVLRNGKAKKTDAPIPADLAPISGGGKRARRFQREEKQESAFLDPIKFRYREEKVVEEPVEPVEEQQEQSGGSACRRNRHKNAAKLEQARQEQTKAELPQQAETEAAAAEKPKQGGHRRHHYHHHRRKPKAE